ncbi:MAG: DUF2784 domain-containing protein [Gammaproteobacteria bacterium]|nr:DUF2784 domain-containing protein [Gammaproteobacteria bacterium]
MSPTWLLLAADGLLIIHALFIAFVVFGLIFIIAGLVRGWRWIRNPWFRFIHLGAIGVVVIQAWLNIICPLTIWENSLRDKAGEATYAGSFIQHWLHKLIFYQAEAWVFTLCYTVFGALVVLAWYLAPPSSFPRRRESSE